MDMEALNKDKELERLKKTVRTMNAQNFAKQSEATRPGHHTLTLTLTLTLAWPCTPNNPNPSPNSTWRSEAQRPCADNSFTAVPVRDIGPIYCSRSVALKSRMAAFPSCFHLVLTAPPPPNPSPQLQELGLRLAAQNEQLKGEFESPIAALNKKLLDLNEVLIAKDAQLDSLKERARSHYAASFAKESEVTTPGATHVPLCSPDAGPLALILESSFSSLHSLVLTLESSPSSPHSRVLTL